MPRRFVPRATGIGVGVPAVAQRRVRCALEHCATAIRAALDRGRQIAVHRLTDQVRRDHEDERGQRGPYEHQPHQHAMFATEVAPQATERRNPALGLELLHLE